MTCRGIVTVILAATSSAAYAQGGPDAAPGQGRVWVDAQVVERLRDRPVEGLTQADFEVLDAGRPATITFFAAGQVPLDLVIVEPASDASRMEGVPSVIDELPLAFEELRPGDRVAIVRASPRGEVVLGLSGDLRAARDNLLRPNPRRKPRKSDCLYDAVSMAATVLRQSSSGLRRRAIVIVADDRESGSKQTQAAATAAALKADATVSILVLRTRVEPIPVVSRGMPPEPLPVPMGRFPVDTGGHNWQSVRPIVSATGGDFLIQAQRSGSLPGLMRRLQARYLLGFSPLESQAGKPHDVSVRVKGPRGANAEVRARTQYWILRDRTD